jgi:glycosidase
MQGDEIGVPDGPRAEKPLDRHGRDAFRLPMLWDSSATGGFTTGTPWLPSLDASQRNIEDQERDLDSQLALVRRLIALRPDLGPDVQLLPSAPDTVALSRGSHVVAVNFGRQPRPAPPAPPAGELVLEARPGDGQDLSVIPAHGGWIARAAALT